jgi:Mor family transcriptional regulator
VADTSPTKTEEAKDQSQKTRRAEYVHRLLTVFNPCDYGSTHEVSLLADTIGREATLWLMVRLGGLRFYISKTRVLNRLKAQYVAHEFDGRNLRCLALELDVSETTALKWLKQSRNSRRVRGCA